LVCDIYRTSSLQSDPNQIYGPIVSFNLRDGQGAWISNAEIEKLAAIKDIHLRTGNLCNPGGIASSLNLTSMQLKKFFASGHRCGNENDIIGGNPTGMTRVSLGAMSTLDDVRTLVDFLKEFFVDRNVTPSVPHSMHDTSHSTTFYIESLVIYPIKSCGGWRVPHGSKWDIKPEGLAWDREWCLVHRGSRAALSQKRYPKMAMLKPSFDFDAGILHVRYCGSTPPSVDNEIIIPLLSDPSLFHAANPADVSTCSRVCGERIQVQIYASPTITQFFSIVLGVPCHLARFPPEGSGPSLRHSKPDLASTKMSPHRSTPPHPILLSNDSPILTISRSSLNSLNEAIKSQSAGGKAASADVFRANIIIAEDPSFAPGIERPFIEDTWRFMEIDSAADAPRSGGTGERGTGTVLEVLGKCRRCHMVCVDQGTGERNEEPFVTLAKTRRVDGKVYFGVHMGILGGAACIQAGDRVQGIGDMEV
jgi:molybdenum cofactor sulfurtransferase